MFARTPGTRAGEACPARRATVGRARRAVDSASCAPAPSALQRAGPGRRQQARHGGRFRQLRSTPRPCPAPVPPRPPNLREATYINRHTAAWGPGCSRGCSSRARKCSRHGPHGLCAACRPMPAHNRFREHAQTSLTCADTCTRHATAAWARIHTLAHRSAHQRRSARLMPAESAPWRRWWPSSQHDGSDCLRTGPACAGAAAT